MTRTVPPPLAACAAWLCACSTPTPQIVLGLAAGPTQACPQDCASIPMPCDAVMSIRIVDPGADPTDPNQRLLDQCVTVPPNNKNNLCALNQINLDPVSLPVRDLAVQIAVFPGSEVPVDGAGKLKCPDVAYSSATGFPVEQAAAPAFGRQAFYHPGEATVNIDLGCTDLSAMQAGETCIDPSAGAATATVDDFNTRVPVTVGPGGTANDLFVWSGEPHVFNGSFVLTPADVVAMRLDGDGTPHWTAETAQTFSRYACVEVLEDVAQPVATLHCALASDPRGELTGYLISHMDLGPIIQTVMGGGTFPDSGLTIGVVVDATAKAVGNVAVKASGPAHIMYPQGGSLSHDATFNNGIFVSDDAQFGTMFSVPGARPALGGLVAGKATIVVLAIGSAP
ncbi:MAG TPA: hypothetical protein VHW23_36010 [Kofleriaceae bacterium]|nr:hypothetical protein [Kofleriaceae bacterium]